jgi:hypothetical protein
MRRAKARIERAKLTYQMLVESANEDAASNNAARNNAGRTSAASTDEAHVRSNGERERAVAEQGGVTAPLEREEFDAMRAAMADLERLERYRRRAWSRQRRAFQRFMEIQSAAFETGRAGTSNSDDQADVHENQGVLDGSS